jgi:uncharacterized protein YndB with AHSA1/START domain
MSLVDTTAASQTDTLSFDLDLPHAPEKVWRALTEPALLERWLLPVIGLELAPGAAFTLKTQAYGDWDGTVSCKMIAIEPPRRLSYAWVVGAMAIDTIVTFTLAPTASGTKLSIAQSGFEPEQKQNFAGARYGWKMMGGKLADVLASLP